MKTRLQYELCRVAYWAVLTLPHTSRLWFALLPYAGAFAYSEDHRGLRMPSRAVIRAAKEKP